MNDGATDAESAPLTHEEAHQVLRLSPEGLRRLADLDEAIIELRAARRSLLVNRLESLKDAFAAARTGRSEGGAGVTAVVSGAAGNGSGNGNSDRSEAVPAVGAGSAGGGTAKASTPAVARWSSNEGAASPLESELRMLRQEVAELRSEVGQLRGGSHLVSEAELQQLNRRLVYLEAELESRQG